MTQCHPMAVWLSDLGGLILGGLLAEPWILILIGVLSWMTMTMTGVLQLLLQLWQRKSVSLKLNVERNARCLRSALLERLCCGMSFWFGFAACSAAPAEAASEAEAAAQPESERCSREQGDRGKERKRERERERERTTCSSMPAAVAAVAPPR